MLNQKECHLSFELVPTYVKKSALFKAINTNDSAFIEAISPEFLDDIDVFHWLVMAAREKELSKFVQHYKDLFANKSLSDSYEYAINKALKMITNIFNNPIHYLHIEGNKERFLKDDSQSSKHFESFFKDLVFLLRDPDFEILTALSSMLTKEEFDSYLSSKDFTLTDEALKMLVTLEEMIGDLKTPLRNLPVLGKDSSDIDVLLSRSYNKDYDITSIYTCYKFLMEIDNISKEILQYLAAKIRGGNTIKLYFKNSDDGSFYDTEENVIFIADGCSQIGEECIAKTNQLCGSIIHEVGHWFYHNVFLNNGGLPFSLSSVINFLSRIQDDHDFTKNNLLEHVEKAHRQAVCTEVTAYMEAAKAPVEEAARMLGVELDVHSNPLDYYICSDLLEKAPELGNIYNSPDISKANTTYNTKYHLTHADHNFLERIADYCLRSHIEFSSDEQIYNVQLTGELIVRYSQLKCTGATEEHLSSFNQLVAYHQAFASPIAQSYIHAQSGVPDFLKPDVDFPVCDYFEKVVF